MSHQLHLFIPVHDLIGAACLVCDLRSLPNLAHLRLGLSLFPTMRLSTVCTSWVEMHAKTNIPNCHKKSLLMKNKPPKHLWILCNKPKNWPLQFLQASEQNDLMEKRQTWSLQRIVSMPLRSTNVCNDSSGGKSNWPQVALHKDWFWTAQKIWSVVPLQNCCPEGTLAMTWWATIVSRLQQPLVHKIIGKNVIARVHTMDHNPIVSCSVSSWHNNKFTIIFLWSWVMDMHFTWFVFRTLSVFHYFLFFDAESKLCKMVSVDIIALLGFSTWYVKPVRRTTYRLLAI